MNATNVMIVQPQPSDVVSMYRSMGPWYDLIRSGREHIHITLNPPLEYMIATQFHVGYFGRPDSASQTNVMRILKRAGVKIWVDYDDLLLDLPDDNPGYSHWAKPEVKLNVVKALGLADVVTVSTTQLKKVLQQFAENIVVVPNAVSEPIYGKRLDENPKKEKLNLVNWRGSATHMKDLMSHGDGFIQAMKKNPTWKAQFIGYLPWFLSPALENQMMFVETLPTDQYFDYINKLQPKIQIVPLYDSIFNRSKSNIAYLEGCFARSYTLAPDWPEWRKPGVLNYSDEMDFKEKLDYMMNNDVRQAVEDGWQYIKENLTLDQTNEIREGILMALKHGLDLPKSRYELDLGEDDNSHLLQLRLDKDKKSVKHISLDDTKGLLN